jgi:hypothetical protein
MIVSAAGEMPAKPRREASGPSFIIPCSASVGSSGCWTISASKPAA